MEQLRAAAQTRYARSGDVNVAYQVTGDGPIDLVFVPGFFSHLEYAWENPLFARFLMRLASFARLIRFDKRGTGLSDRVTEMPALEQRMDDVRAVMDAVGSRRAVLLGISEGAPMSILFAATYPERCQALIMYGSFARMLWAPDYPHGATPEDIQATLDKIDQAWGSPVGVERLAPSMAGDERFRDWWAAHFRLSASPGAAKALVRMNAEIDVRHLLPAISVPTLILHRTGDRSVPIAAARYMATRIARAKYVELPGDDHMVWVGDPDAVLRAIEEFVTVVTGVRPADRVDRLLTTVLLLEIVDAVECAARLGDGRWHECLEDCHAIVVCELDRFRGREIGSPSEQFSAMFDGPARAIRCALATIAATRPLGIELRAGIHTGECEVSGDRVSGITRHIAARVAANAAAGEVLVSRMVKDLIAGAGLWFEERGVRSLKGVPGELRLFAATDDPARVRTVMPALHEADGSSAQQAGTQLTRREREVVALVARGLTNRQIAEALGITEGTARIHVEHILSKLDFHARAQLSAWAVEQGFLVRHS